MITKRKIRKIEIPTQVNSKAFCVTVTPVDTMFLEPGGYEPVPPPTIEEPMMDRFKLGSC
jgi:hypothetical protein